MRRKVATQNHEFMRAEQVRLDHTAPVGIEDNHSLGDNLGLCYAAYRKAIAWQVDAPSKNPGPYHGVNGIAERFGELADVVAGG
jgi:hypothetical protein